MNKDKCIKLTEDGRQVEETWAEILVGDILLVRQDEFFPTDVVCVVLLIELKLNKCIGIDRRQEVKILRNTEKHL